jgi:hypothetical protein
MGEEGSRPISFTTATSPRPTRTPRRGTFPTRPLASNHPLTPRHFKLHELFGEEWKTKNVVTGRRLVLGNEDVRIS